LGWCLRSSVSGSKKAEGCHYAVWCLSLCLEPVHCACRPRGSSQSILYVSYPEIPERLVNAMLISCSRCCVIIPCSSQTPPMQCNNKEKNRKIHASQKCHQNPKLKRRSRCIARSLTCCRQTKECLPIIHPSSIIRDPSLFVIHAMPCYAVGNSATIGKS
jgi:hypothetical protein